MRDEVSATVTNEKSWLTMAPMNTASAASTARDQRVHRAAGREDQATVAAAGAEHRGDRRVDAQQQGEDQRPTAERGHQDWAESASPGVYFDGHFVTSESAFAWNTPPVAVPSRTISRPALKASGTLPRYTTGIVCPSP